MLIICSSGIPFACHYMIPFFVLAWASVLRAPEGEATTTTTTAAPATKKAATVGGPVAATPAAAPSTASTQPVKEATAKGPAARTVAAAASAADVPAPMPVLSFGSFGPQDIGGGEYARGYFLFASRTFCLSA
jgi:hypothetical protein